MDAVANPYAPGAGERPPELTGRFGELEAWIVTLQRTEQRKSHQPLVLHGLRGVGKTVLLNELRAEAERRGWIVASIEAGAGRALRDQLSRDLQKRVGTLARRQQGRPRLLELLRTAVSLKVSTDPTGSVVYGIDLRAVDAVPADSGDLEVDLEVLADALVAATEDGFPGAAIFIDEAQDLTAEERIALAAFAHRIAQERLPVAIAVAGLPSLPRLLSEARSYSERFMYREIGSLGDDDARDALVGPARELDVEWDDDAVASTIERTRGYPFQLQLFGQEIWNAAEDRLDVIAADIGAETAREEMDGLYRSRWQRATPAERDYLVAMAVDGEQGSRSGAVAERLGKDIASLGPARANLIAKGLVYAPEHGAVHFTVPGMADYIATRVD